MNIFLTGVTGLVGGELLVRLSQHPGVDKIYCLIRAKSDEEAKQRLQKVFGVHNDYFDTDKIIPVTGDLLGEQLPAQLAHQLAAADIDTIIHSAANTSFSGFNDDLVEKVNIGGLQKILTWAQTLAGLRSFVYVGTATICGTHTRHRVIGEDESPNLSATHVVKYTYTKMRGELLIRESLPAEKILIVRPSIIMGDSRPLLPRSPVILWAMATINHLRLIPVNEAARLDIVSVDYTVNAITALLFARRKHQVYHISAGAAGATSTRELANMLTSYYAHLPAFKFVPQHMIQQIRHWTRGKLAPVAELNEHQQYLDHWLVYFKSKNNLRLLFSGLSPYLDFMELGHVFDNSRLLEDTGIENIAPAHKYMQASLGFLDKINVLEGAIDP